MVRASDLLGSLPVAHFECMYTKHKTQKRKTWQDGFLSVFASRRLALHQDGPLQGKRSHPSLRSLPLYIADLEWPGSLLGEAKMAPADFHKEFEFIDFAKCVAGDLGVTTSTAC